MSKSSTPTNQASPATKNASPSANLPDVNTKAYIDIACQASSNTIISTIKKYIDQTMSAHMVLINKINECIEASLNQQKQSPQLTYANQSLQDTVAIHNH
ncbi:27249_t:CDS:1, partial [Racocetra persica]